MVRQRDGNSKNPNISVELQKDMMQSSQDCEAVITPKQIVKLLKLLIRNPKTSLDPREHQAVARPLQLLYTVLGYYFVRGFRILQFDLERHLILWKRHDKKTQYVVIGFEQQLGPEQNQRVNKWIEQAQKYLNRVSRNLEGSQLCLLNIQDYSTTLCSFKSIMQRTTKHFRLPNPQLPEIVDLQNKWQPITLRRFVCDYVDRFGIFKKALLQYELKFYHSAFQLDILFQTIDYIIAKELIEGNYKRAESETWSIFALLSKTWQYNRRDQIFRGDDRILIVDYLFMEEIKDYITEDYLKEISELISHHKSKGFEVEFKIYRITNELDSWGGMGMIYLHQTRRITNSDFMRPREKIATRSRSPRKKRRQRFYYNNLEYNESYSRFRKYSQRSRSQQYPITIDDSDSEENC